MPALPLHLPPGRCPRTDFRSGQQRAQVSAARIGFRFRDGRVSAKPPVKPRIRSLLVPTRALLACILLHVASGTCRATTFLADGYAVRVWQTQDGLPRNMVTSAIQTHDGYLWFGTYSGLARFDGERFRIFDAASSPGLGDRRITRLFEDAQGTLWLGHDSGLITRYREGRFEPVDLPSRSIEGKILGLGSDEDGRMWAQGENGAVDRLDGVTRLKSLLGTERPGVMSFSRGARGHIWLSENGTAARVTEGGLIRAALPPPQSNNYVMCVASASDGGAWIFCDGRIRKWANDRWTDDRGEYPWPMGGIACALELRDGTLAIGTIQWGLYLVFGDGRPPARFDRTNGLPQNWIRFIYEDREGNIWAAAGSAGLASIHTSALSVLPLPEEAQGCSALSVAAGPDRSLWIGTDGAGLYHYSSNTWRHYGADQGLMNYYIPSVAVGPDREVWASDLLWGGLYRLKDGYFSRPEGIEEASNPVYSLLPIGEGGWLAGNRDGLRLWNDGRSSWLIRSPDVSAPEVCAVARDHTGAIWCGFAHGGVARFADNRVAHWRQADGLASDAVNSMAVDDDGTLWIGTADRGLSRFKDGRFTNLDLRNGLIDNAIAAILDDGRGCLWMSTHHGIQRVAKDELNRCADGRSATFASQIYDRGDGLPIIEFTSGFQPVATKAPDGRLWFACGEGLVGVDPARIESNPIPPPVVIDSVWVDGASEPIAPGRLPDRLVPDHERIEFRFSGLSFVAPGKVLFRYRLEGIDKTWVDAGPKRTAFYSRLPKGTYHFHVIACNNDGLWNTDGASLAFTVAPFFWQTWWFVSSCSLAGLSLFALVVRFITRRRMQQRMLELKRQHAIERERARIAQDIHDDVGSSLARIAMLSQPASSTLAEPQRTAAMLSRIYATAREVTRSLDEIVWAVDPTHDTLDSLIIYMGKFAQDFLAAASVRCRIDAPVDLPNWRITAETRHNLFLAFKEVLANAVKHAAASEVRIALALHHDSFVLTVTDNGRGFDPQNPATTEPDRIASGRGLGNLQRRLASIGGQCKLSSEPGRGTSVSFLVAIENQSAPSPTPTHASTQPESPSPAR